MVTKTNFQEKSKTLAPNTTILRGRPLTTPPSPVDTNANIKNKKKSFIHLFEKQVVR
jgi:hypothetical protein